MLRFPSVKEIPLENPPIAEVICQVRFPILLRITAEMPVEFQERIRDLFPILEVQHGLTVQVDPLGDAAAKAEQRIFRFKSEDGTTVVSLSPDFFAISTTAYSHWDEFLDQINLVATAAIEIYRLKHATRIGLRYVNHLTKKNTKVANASEVWNILRSELTQLWSASPWEEPNQAIHHLVLSISESERMTIRTGYQRDEEPTCILDFDCYTTESNVPIEGLSDYCSRYHDLIYQAFRWCVQEQKLAVFGVSNKVKAS